MRYANRVFRALIPTLTIVLHVLFLGSLAQVPKAHAVSSGTLSPEVAAKLQWFKNQIGSADYVGLELWIADSSTAAAESAFGHAALRLVDGRGSDFDDPILALVAQDDASPWRSAKAITGQYPFVAQVQPLNFFLSSYRDGERRRIKRLVLPSDSESRKKIVHAIEELIVNPSVLGKYKFTSNNCTDAILAVLEKAGYRFPLGGLPRIPVSVESWQKSSLAFPFPPEEVVPATTQLEEAAAKTDIDLNELLPDRTNSEKAAGKLAGTAEWSVAIRAKLAGWDTLDLQRLRQVLPREAIANREFLRKVLGARGDRKGPHEVIGLREVPASFYEYCSTEECAARVQSDFEKAGPKGKQGLLAWMRQNRAEAERTRQLSFYPQIRNLPQVKHFQLISRASTKVLCP